MLLFLAPPSSNVVFNADFVCLLACLLFAVSSPPDLDATSTADAFITGAPGELVTTLTTIPRSQAVSSQTAFIITSSRRVGGGSPAAPLFTLQTSNSNIVTVTVGAAAIPPGDYLFTVHGMDRSADGLTEGLVGATSTVFVHVAGLVVDGSTIGLTEAGVGAVQGVNVSLATRPRAGTVTVVVSVVTAAPETVTPPTPLPTTVSQVVLQRYEAASPGTNLQTALTLSFTAVDWAEPQCVYVTRNPSLGLLSRLSFTQLAFQLQESASHVALPNAIKSAAVTFDGPRVSVLALYAGAVSSFHPEPAACEFISGQQCTLVWRGVIGEVADTVTVTIVNHLGSFIAGAGTVERSVVSLPAVGSLVWTVPFLPAGEQATPTLRLQLHAIVSATGESALGYSPHFTVSPPFRFVTTPSSVCVPEQPGLGYHSVTAQPCGSGWHRLGITCVSVTGQVQPSLDSCLLYDDMPADRARCFQPCGLSRAANPASTAVYWHTLAWQPCLGCGAGRVQTRQVTCVDPAGVAVPADDPACVQAAATAPASSQVCATTSCGVSYEYSDWGVCSARCGTGVAVRRVRCVDDSGVDLLDLNRCVAALGPPVNASRPCVAAVPSCDRYHYKTSAWSTCSQPCVSALGKDAVVGVSTRSVICVVNGSVPVSTKECVTRSVPQPVASLPCNNFPCPAVSFALRVSSWSTCTHTGRSGNQCNAANPFVGIATRTVSCVQGAVANGLPIAGLQLCASHDGVDVPRTQACTSIDSRAFAQLTVPIGAVVANNTGLLCRCTSNADCRANSACDALRGVCACNDGFIGPDCATELARVTADTNGCAGVIDSQGSCCLGTIRPADGRCCGNSTTVLDGSGECCAGRVDACGVCNGHAIAVDVRGACCTSPLPPNGLCCDGLVDDCGT
jgi:hypothetical protein